MKNSLTLRSTISVGILALCLSVPSFSLAQESAYCFS